MDVRTLCALVALLLVACSEAGSDRGFSDARDAHVADAPAVKDGGVVDAGPASGAGALAWVRAITGEGTGRVLAMAAHTDGSVAVAGEFSGPLIFDEGGPAETTLPLEIGAPLDAFVARYAEDGTFMWAHGYGADHSVDARGIALMSDGSVVVTGGQALWLARYSPDGTLIWSTSTPGALPLGLVILQDGTSVVLGITTTSGPVVFGKGEPNETVFDPPDDGSSEFFLARYLEDGSFSSLKTVGFGVPAGEWTGSIWPLGCAAAEGAGVLIVGKFCGTAMFDGGDAGQTNLVSQPPQCSAVEEPDTGDAFLGRVEPDGTFLWATRVASGQGFASALAAGTLADGTLRVPGYFHGETSLAAGTQEEIKTTGTGMYVAALTSGGQNTWARVVVESSEESYAGGEVGWAPDGSFAMAGSIQGTATFGPGSAGESTIEAPEKPWRQGSQYLQMTAIVARYSGDGSLVWVHTIDNAEGQAAVVLPDGRVIVAGGFAATADFGTGGLVEASLTADEWGDLFVALYEQ